jgi:hypothetical protein
MVRLDPLALDGLGICPHCGHKAKSSRFGHQLETCHDPLLDRGVTRRRRVPVRIYGRTGTANWVRGADEADLAAFRASEAGGYPASAVAKPIEWGELRRGGYHTGITHLHHFYTRRNFRVMTLLWEKTLSLPAGLGDAVRLLLLSYNAAHATLMTRVVVKTGSKDLILSGAQSGVLFVSSMPVEKNLLLGLTRKAAPFEEAFKHLSMCSGRMRVRHASARRLDLADRSADYVFTDPPFGDFIPYAEVNQINELWLGEPTDRSEEIIISPSQGKTVADYRSMMTEVLGEAARVLKDGAMATMVFHASKAAVWEALRSACLDAGFRFEAAASLEKTQVSFKQVVSEGSVRGDPLILLSKGRPGAAPLRSSDILEEAVSESPAGARPDERKIYASYVGKCLTRGVPVEYDAKAAYERVARLALKPPGDS